MWQSQPKVGVFDLISAVLKGCNVPKAEVHRAKAIGWLLTLGFGGPVTAALDTGH
jgi:hypothetical protein